MVNHRVCACCWVLVWLQTANYILLDSYIRQLTLKKTWCFLLQVLICFPQPTPAPVPRCSPFLFINKWAEFNSFWSDSNPYFPLPPCEYGGPLEALAAGDIKAVSVLASPLKVPRHNFYVSWNLHQLLTNNNNNDWIGAHLVPEDWVSKACENAHRTGEVDHRS